jgi:hypothetical protein
MCIPNVRHPSCGRSEEDTLAMAIALPDTMTEEEAKKAVYDLWGCLPHSIEYDANRYMETPPYQMSNCYLPGGVGFSWKEAIIDNITQKSNYQNRIDIRYHYKDNEKCFVLRDGITKDDKYNYYWNGILMTEDDSRRYKESVCPKK